MAQKRSAKRTEAVLKYPPHWFSPEDLLLFIELPHFSRRWEELGLDDSDKSFLQALIMLSPKGNPVIRETGGLRKMRCGRNEKGKSAGFRVCYVYFEEFATVLLVLIYPKNEMDTLPPKSKQAIRKLIAEAHKELASRPYRAGPRSEEECETDDGAER
ncbi:Toxin HigB-2 [Gemmata sp. SH-PL17]|uniref:hypothetical protein n=1 Tax=Gemmata sp. SH-PL17 TaxID=1630693 RepID=UPI00078D3C0F|nr:hypothetical protein [Gemmata sp. SH-PL17]AMV23437.1 Toxin HigB-2 [Gemmata sp. SH-PL17]